MNNNQYLVLEGERLNTYGREYPGEADDSFLSLTSSCSYFDPPVEDYYSKTNFVNFGKNQGNYAIGMGVA